MDELCFTLVQNSTDVRTIPLLNDIKVPCLFWADDLVLISTTKERLQKQINFIDKYCNDWKLALTVEKTKTVIFNENGPALSKNQLKYRGQQIKPVKYFNYLGITLEASRSLYRLSTFNYISIITMLDAFDSLVKPILLFSSEIWSHDSKDHSGEIEKNII